MKTISLGRSAAAFVVLTLLGVWVCTDRPTIFDNPDPNLRLSSSELRGDALARFPYKEEAPKASEIKARAQVAYQLNRMEVVNFSDVDWDNVEVWVNHGLG